MCIMVAVVEDWNTGLGRPPVLCVSLTSSTRARDAGKKVMNTR